MDDIRTGLTMGLITEMVHITDDTFPLSPVRVAEFAQRYKAEFPSLPFGCMMRIDQIVRNPIVIDDLLKAGLSAAFIGVESGSASVLRRLGKPYTADDTMNVVTYLAGRLRNLQLSFIWGFPFETRKDFMTTQILMQRIYAKFGKTVKLDLLFSQLSPMPQTTIYDEYVGQLAFSEKFLSAVVMTSGDSGQALSDRRAYVEPDARTKVLIRENKDVFAGFCYVKSDAFAETSQLAEGAHLLLRQILEAV
jgi:radical SAM superfamily enzyme YgiQ (UPF0313 family)